MKKQNKTKRQPARPTPKCPKVRATWQNEHEVARSCKARIKRNGEVVLPFLFSPTPMHSLCLWCQCDRVTGELGVMDHPSILTCPALPLLTTFPVANWPQLFLFRRCWWLEDMCVVICADDLARTDLSTDARVRNPWIVKDLRHLGPLFRVYRQHPPDHMPTFSRE